jgi:flavodoxin I
MTAIVVYGSTTGNTRFLSEFVKLGLEDVGYEFLMFDVKDIRTDYFNSKDLIVLGSSTWNIGSTQGQLQHDWRSFIEEMKHYNFEQRPVGVFGVGHYHYTFTAGAADVLSEGVKQANGRLLDPVYKVDDVVDLFTEQIRAWASGLAHR